MVIAIDGPAGSGKSTVAKKAAEALGFYFLNTGSFYRAYTLSALENGIDPSDRDKVLENAERHVITVEDGAICLDGKNVEGSLHTPEVDKVCSVVSSDPRLRELVTSRVRQLSGTLDIVTEGRDTTTVIFPDAELKFYFDASVEERARRRSAEQTGESYDEVLQGIKERDRQDREKEAGALKISPEAVYVDTSLLTINQVCEIVINAVQTKSV